MFPRLTKNEPWIIVIGNSFKSTACASSLQIGLLGFVSLVSFTDSTMVNHDFLSPALGKYVCHFF